MQCHPADVGDVEGVGQRRPGFTRCRHLVHRFTALHIGVLRLSQGVQGDKNRRRLMVALFFVASLDRMKARS